VKDQVQVAIGAGGGHVEELAAPSHIGDGPAGQRGQRRVEGLQHGKRSRVGTSDDAAFGVLAQERRERFDFRQLRHNYQSKPCFRAHHRTLFDWRDARSRR
jgi:hypothetical protein